MENKIKEDTIALKHFINTQYYKDAFDEHKNLWTPGAITELIIRPECNQKCEYCYIAQHGNELYPKEKRINTTQILKNIDMFLAWLYEHKIFVTQFDLFAGDLFADNLYYKILDVFYDNFTKRFSYIKYENLISNFGDIYILLPTNGFFFQYEDHQKKILEYMNKMEKIHIHPLFSWSTDGLYAANSRENITLKNGITQEYYDKIFPFIIKVKSTVHPMISAENIDTAIENLNWWMEMNEHYGILEKYPYYLEVRNGNWTDEKIEKFVEFVKYIWDIKFKLNDYSIEKMATHLFNDIPTADCFHHHNFYDLGTLTYQDFTNEDELNCQMAVQFRLNITDLSLPICHRLTYPQFVGGRFIVQNNQIIDLNALPGFSSYLQIKMLSPKFYPKCSLCIYRHVCSQGCLGAQYEYNGELLIPIDNVCKMKQSKINTLLQLYNESKVLDYALENDLISNNLFKNWLLNMSYKFGYRKTLE